MNQVQAANIYELANALSAVTNALAGHPDLGPATDAGALAIAARHIAADLLDEARAHLLDDRDPITIHMDEHDGEILAQAAAAAGKSPEELAAEVLGERLRRAAEAVASKEGKA